MRQAIHIFRKDARHCWPYIAGVMAITAVHAWQESVAVPDYPGNLGTGLPAVLITLLLVLAWWLVIGASVHGESLIGDRQFWTTRPYSWKGLLTAKLLFVAAFLMLPLLISDCIILLASAYNPLSLFPGLLWRQCWLLAFLVLPFVLAALSRATREFVLAGIVFYVAAFLGLAALSIPVIGIRLTRLEWPSWIWDFALWLMPVAGFSLVVWQYARRRTILVRVFAIVLGGLAPVVVAMSLFGRMAPFNPAARQDDPRYRNITVQLAADPGTAIPVEVDSRTKGWVTIPVKFSGWPRDLANCLVSGVATTAPGAVYARRVSPEYISNTMIATSGGCESLVFSIADIKTQPSQNVDLWASVFLRLYQRQATVGIQPERGWTRVPGFGNVRCLEDARGVHLIWRTALRPGTPGWAYSLSDGKSDLVTDAEWSGGGAFAWPASPAFFGMSPVYSYVASGLTVVHASATRAPIPRPLVLTIKRLVVTLSRELRIPNIRLTGDETK